MVNTIYNELNSMNINFQTLVSNDNQTVYRMGLGLTNGKVDTIVDLRNQTKYVLISTTCTINVMTLRFFTNDELLLVDS